MTEVMTQSWEGGRRGLRDCHCEKRGELGRREESAQREADRQRHGGRANTHTHTHTHTHTPTYTSWIWRPRREVKTLGQVGQAVQRTTQADPCLPMGVWLHPSTLRTRFRHCRGQQGSSGQSECAAEARPHVWGWSEVPRSCWELHTRVGALSFSCTLTSIHTLHSLIHSLANHTHISSHLFRGTHTPAHSSSLQGTGSKVSESCMDKPLSQSSLGALGSSSKGRGFALCQSSLLGVHPE